MEVLWNKGRKVGKDNSSSAENFDAGERRGSAECLPETFLEDGSVMTMSIEEDSLVTVGRLFAGMVVMTGVLLVIEVTVVIVVIS